MNTDFVIKGIKKSEVEFLFSKSDEELHMMGVSLQKVDKFPGYPCRLSLEDAAIGEEVFLISYEHHHSTTPYRANGPVFIRKDSRESRPEVNEIPKMLDHRLLSLRVYNAEGMMIDARTEEGLHLREEIIDIFKSPEANYIHIHNSGPGCYNCAVLRSA